MAIVKYNPPAPPRTGTTSRFHSIEPLVAEILHRATGPSRTLSGQRRNTARHVIASEAMAAAEKIALAMIRVKIATDECLAETARLETDIAAYEVQQLALGLQADELEHARKALPARMVDEASLEQLRRDVQRAKLNVELHAVQALDAFTYPASDRAAHPPSVTPNLDAERAAAARQRREAEARWIIEDVQAGHVPTGAETPYHAFAACIFVSAQLEGLSVKDAAARAGQVVFDRLVARHPMFAGDPARYKEEYVELKKRLDALTGNRQTATVLAAMQRLGASAAGTNGNGGGVQ